MTPVKNVLLGIVLAGTIGCSGLLDVSDPTVVQDADIANTAGANARRLQTVFEFNRRMTTIASNVALFTDERKIDAQVWFALDFPDTYDRRDQQRYERLAEERKQDPHLDGLTAIVVSANIAIPAVRAFSPDSLRGDFLAQLYVLKGYAILQMAEDLCAGFPVNDIVNNLPVFGEPLSTDSAVRYALSQIDSSLKYVQDSSRFRYLAMTLKGRALLDLGRYVDAGSTVSSVPLDFSYSTIGGQRNNDLWIRDSDWKSGRRRAVGEREGGNGLPFISSNDPRVRGKYMTVRYNDATDSLYDQTKYLDQSAPMVVASGVEAGLIRAEVALSTGQGNWLSVLDTLRSSAISPAMPVLNDPGTLSTRVDLLYRERAFWLYLTGRRLGDLRRLIRNYQRDPQALFPTGPYPLGGLYKDAFAIPFSQAVQGQYNSAIKSGCQS